ncbi:hypothetical protein DAPPUDRAFT_325532 [Daphnia pulex]|uniref:Uncharacterized protein n=1 Tax=Daphnia pulex TaxID=6669 RepID=E9H514_DAPPU|nr:hypothetical protein DAPPUDRAFT_325532 [Daphnia pulex]|eukprot:EFX73263.1 hypothetical protein DAPPUDRAFT_325532 [Daphnia pulex]
MKITLATAFLAVLLLGVGTVEAASISIHPYLSFRTYAIQPHFQRYYRVTMPLQQQNQYYSIEYYGARDPLENRPIPRPH